MGVLRRRVPLLLTTIVALILAALVPASPLRPTRADAGVGDGTPGTLGQYWTGNAEWVFSHKVGGGDWYAGSRVIALSDGTWYLFSRKAFSTPACFDGAGSGTQVRKSTDQGVTWSAPVTIVAPTAGTFWSCHATDGDVFFNPTENKWHFLFQCHTGTQGAPWHGCLLSRASADPMGAFTEPPAVGANPVVANGELWNAICNSTADQCHSSNLPQGRTVESEGTFDIFGHDGANYWVSFHGYDGVNGYRGFAKTPDFQNWITDPAQNVAPDAIHDRLDSQGWREAWHNGTSIGVGHGSMIQEGNLVYDLVEAADKNLACQEDQNWDFGLFRTNALNATVWDQFSGGNPIVYSGKGESGSLSGCNPVYPGLFKDPSTNFTWMYYGRRSTDPNFDAVYFYRLEQSANLLVNSDLWRADAFGWNRHGAATNLAVWRRPNNSPDGTPYLATNCGGPCDPGQQSVFQDVGIPGGTAGTLEFGGKFRSPQGSGNLTLMVHQFDSSYNLLKQDGLIINTTTSWNTFGTSASLLAATTILRYEVYLGSSLTYWADDMYLIK